MNHALYGASIPFAIGAIIYLLRGGRTNLVLLILIPLAMAFMAIWASAPDIPRVLGHQSLYLQLYDDPRMDIFLWHYTIDKNEIESSWYAAGIALEAATLMAVAIRKLVQEEAG